MESQINHTQIGVANDGMLLTHYFAFKFVHSIIDGGGTVEDLKLTYETVSVTKEEGFREFLTSIVSLPYDNAKLSAEEQATLNDLVIYLSTPYGGQPQPVDTSEMPSLGQLLEQLQNPT